jgi:hypothetical protein
MALLQGIIPNSKEVCVKPEMDPKYCPDADDIARVLILAGHMPYREDQDCFGGFVTYGVHDWISVYHRPSNPSDYPPGTEDDLKITAYARALKAVGYLIQPRWSYVKDGKDGVERIEHSLIVRLRD